MMITRRFFGQAQKRAILLGSALLAIGIVRPVHSADPVATSSGIGFSATGSGSFSSFGSPFAGQAFTMGDILRSQGQLPPISTQPTYNTGSCLSLTGNSPRGPQNPFPAYRSGWISYNLGTLGIVSPGWAWYPYLSPYSYSGYGFSTGIYSSGFYPYYGYPGYSPYANTFFIDSGLPFGWMPYWRPIVNPFVLNFGFLGAVAEITNRGNARFGPARPIRNRRPQNRQQNQKEDAAGDARGILIPGVGMANGLGPAAGNQGVAGKGNVGVGPKDPLKQVALIQNQKNANGGLNDLEKNQAKFGQQPVRRLVAAAPLPKSARRSRDAENANPMTGPDLHNWVRQRLQSGDRLAINGLFSEADIQYRSVQERVPDQPAPWFRLAQIAVLTNDPDTALLAWNESEKRASSGGPGYTKQLAWSDVADRASLTDARRNLEKWISQEKYQDLIGLKATLITPLENLASKNR